MNSHLRIGVREIIIEKSSTAEWYVFCWKQVPNFPVQNLITYLVRGEERAPSVMNKHVLGWFNAPQPVFYARVPVS